MSTFQSERTDADAPNDGSRLTGSAVLPAGLAHHRGFAGAKCALDAIRITL
jgi:hypothetical protein